MSAFEKKITRLEQRLLPPTNGCQWEEYQFWYYFRTNWPDPDTAPKFALADFRRLEKLMDAIRKKNAEAADSETKEPAHEA